MCASSFPQFHIDVKTIMTLLSTVVAAVAAAALFQTHTAVTATEPFFPSARYHAKVQSHARIRHALAGGTEDPDLGPWILLDATNNQPPLDLRNTDHTYYLAPTPGTDPDSTAWDKPVQVYSSRALIGDDAPPAAVEWDADLRVPVLAPGTMIGPAAVGGDGDGNMLSAAPVPLIRDQDWMLAGSTLRRPPTLHRRSAGVDQPFRHRRPGSENEEPAAHRVHGWALTDSMHRRVAGSLALAQRVSPAAAPDQEPIWIPLAQNKSYAHGESSDVDQVLQEFTAQTCRSVAVMSDTAMRRMHAYADPKHATSVGLHVSATAGKSGLGGGTVAVIRRMDGPVRDTMGSRQPHRFGFIAQSLAGNPQPSATTGRGRQFIIVRARLSAPSADAAAQKTCTLREHAFVIRVNGHIVASKQFVDGSTHPLQTLVGEVPTNNRLESVAIEAVARYHERECTDRTRFEVHRFALCDAL
ncbi:hypothetical protein BC828DRAFT_391468 [Blastocladiella britannica]|nr:hypothetical protein BC828DRAFT_391468 [Blastocladiella britannica]